MQTSEINIKEIRKEIIQGISLQFVPLYLVGLIRPGLEKSSGLEFLLGLLSILIILTFFCGYSLCADAAGKYANHKGYKNHWYAYSLLNIFGLSILFLLDNKNTPNALDEDKHPLENFSIMFIFISWIVIPLLLYPFAALFALCISGVQGFEEYFKNENFETISNVPMMVIYVWYFIKEFKRTSISFKSILGSFARIDFKLPIVLAVINYLFNKGFNSSSLYGLSFIFPEYVESQINQEYATTLLGWICFAISALIFAPIMEELICRGIIFQKLTITGNFTKALLISAMVFAVMHFRYDMIPLFIAGVITVILYVKTKQLTVPIIYHFTYNLIFIIRRAYHQVFFDTDLSSQTTVIEYQQQFVDNFELYMLFILISIPYLSYFIYKNFPRNFSVEKLPYLVNQQRAS